MSHTCKICFHFVTQSSNLRENRDLFRVVKCLVDAQDREVMQQVLGSRNFPICLYCKLTIDMVYKFQTKVVKSLKFIAAAERKSKRGNNDAHKQDESDESILVVSDSFTGLEDCIEDEKQETACETTVMSAQPSGSETENIQIEINKDGNGNSNDMLFIEMPSDTDLANDAGGDRVVISEDFERVINFFESDSDGDGNGSNIDYDDEDPNGTKFRKLKMTNTGLTRTLNSGITCHICKEPFSTQIKLKLHMTTHTGEMPYKCKFCGKPCKNQGRLNEHVRIHTGEKPHVCEFCGKGFAQSSQLNTHRRLHTGRPYKCEVCDKRFCRPSEVTVHMRNHTGEKPFLCTLCGKTFRFHKAFKQHRMYHSDERNYICSVCGKAFKVKTGLQRHCLIHKDEKPYECPICPYSCRQKGNLKLHMKVHNKIPDSRKEPKFEIEFSDRM